MALCLVAGAIAATLAVDAFTLAWTHSIEKIRWEEDWRVAGRALVLQQARVRGTGAGMEPPPDAVFENGAWRYRPRLPPQETIRLTHSPHTAGYELCVAGRCGPLAERLPGIDNTAVIEIRNCSP
ncbi:DUF1850 domain-containing protein [Sulfurisoma sediminicola]|uniref:Uncharacterized protein DUF1850 n=1 Tax=Sulfurisoma sediminicola TaxID=1381557 RepID=A0A497XNU6_9PROT|nr:DUF1850 domain-containing protein [Sulfurisoma sediminicola]RLJ67869.1 uncharacterized protein DUF1850 [Sulfurisoma sediminicola]